MRACIQRVSSASVRVAGELVGEIGTGILVLLGVAGDDTEADLTALADKMAGLRIFEDENEKMNLSVGDVDGDILAISQFTLYADCRKGNRPSFTGACPPVRANELYEFFCGEAEKLGVKVERGIFGADMQVALVNDGPVTIMLDSDEIVKR